MDKMDKVIENVELSLEDIDLIVVIDFESIFGIGDWGVGGINIVVGKLVVYIVVVGIDLSCVFFIVLDVGINNKELFKDLFYLGNCYECVIGEVYN